MGVDLLTQAHGIVCLFEMQVCESVKLKLLGKKVGTFARIRTLVVEALTESIVRILTPHKSIDVLREALAAKVGESGCLSFVCHTGWVQLLLGCCLGTRPSIRCGFYRSKRSWKVDIPLKGA